MKELAVKEKDELLVPALGLRESKQTPSDTLLDYLAINDKKIKMMIDGEEKTVIVDRMSYLANHITNNLIKEEKELEEYQTADGDIDVREVVTEKLDRTLMKAMIDLLKIKEDKSTTNASSRVDTLIALLLEKRGKEDEGFVESLLAKKAER